MTTISLKVPEDLMRELNEASANRGVPKSAIIRESLETTLQKLRKPKKKVSCLDLMGDGVGSFHGPRDLSTNRRYLIEAVTANARRRKTSP